MTPLSTYVFPAPSGSYLRHPHRAIPALRKRSGVVDLRLHDVRKWWSAELSRLLAAPKGEPSSRESKGDVELGCHGHGEGERQLSTRD